MTMLLIVFNDYIRKMTRGCTCGMAHCILNMRTNSTVNMIDGISFELLIHALVDSLQDPVTLLGVELPFSESALTRDDLLAVLIIYRVKCVII